MNCEITPVVQTAAIRNGANGINKRWDFLKQAMNESSSAVTALQEASERNQLVRSSRQARHHHE